MTGAARHSWFPASSCDSSCLTDESTAGRIRRWWRMTGLLVIVFGVLALGVVVGFLPRHVRARYVKLSAYLLIRALGIRVDVRDERVAQSGQGLIVSNHLSFLDVLAIATVSPARFVAKAELASWPVIGAVTRRLGVIPIRRESLRELPTVVDSARRGLLAGDDIGAFPEGTTRCGRGGGRFRPALFQAAIDSGLPIRPVVVSFHTSTGDVSTAPCFIGVDHIGDTMRRILRAKGLTVRVRMCQQQLPGDDRRELARRCERVVFGKTPELVLPDPASVALAG